MIAWRIASTGDSAEQRAHHEEHHADDQRHVIARHRAHRRAELPEEYGANHWGFLQRPASQTMTWEADGKQAKATLAVARVAKKAIYLGKVEAADAMEKYDIDPEHQDRLAARRIVTAE